MKKKNEKKDVMPEVEQEISKLEKLLDKVIKAVNPDEEFLEKLNFKFRFATNNLRKFYETEANLLEGTEAITAERVIRNFICQDRFYQTMEYFFSLIDNQRLVLAMADGIGVEEDMDSNVLDFDALKSQAKKNLVKKGKAAAFFHF